MSELYFNPQNPLVDGNKASRPFVRFLNALVKSLGTGSGPILPGPITAAGLTMNSSRLLGRTSGGIGDPQEISVDSTLTLAAGVLGVAAGAAIVQRSVVTLNNTQIRDLPTTPVQVVPAPASGSRIRLLAVSFVFNTLAGAYTNLDAAYADLSLLVGADYMFYGIVNDIGATPVLAQLSDVLAVADRRVVDGPLPYSGATLAGAGLGYVVGNVSNGYGDQDGTPVMLAIYNGSGNLTGGNAANSLKCTVLYTVEAL